MSTPNPARPTGFSAALLAGTLWGSLLALQGVALAGRALGRPVDGLTLVIATLTLFVGANVATFSQRYMRADPQGARYIATVAGLIAGVLAFASATDLAVLGVAWCSTGWLLARLIGHDTRQAEAQAAARRAQWSFVAGDGALLAGLALLGVHAGSLRIDAALAGVASLPQPLAIAAALLLLTAAAARCALPPFSGWLLSSMTAPTPVSALMHAGLVNAGGFLLLRFAPLFEAAPAARLAALGLGLVAVVQGIGVMMVRPDIKRSLAGSTVSQMGFMIMSCALGAYAAALWHIVAHGLFKAWLFLGSGSSVGMKVARPAPQRADSTPVVVAAAVLIGGIALVRGGHATGTLLPLLLAIATAGATLASAVRSASGLRTRLSLLVLVAALVGFHGAGLAVVAAVSRPDGPALVPAPLLIALAALFLAAWVWQQRALALGRPLPRRLYIHMLNAGALRAAPAGDAQ
jgi:NADH:ubiquinone oxidoreductase subunit 5 (subunit L)/multisubunit Na+/H+ antiporter MnhA subunit